MAKPIFLIGVPVGDNDEDLRIEALEKIQEVISEEIYEEYHVIVHPRFYETEFNFQVFYEKDFDEVKYEELKQIVLGSIKN